MAYGSIYQFIVHTDLYFETDLAACPLELNPHTATKIVERMGRWCVRTREGERQGGSKRKRAMDGEEGRRLEPLSVTESECGRGESWPGSTTRS